MERKKRWQNNTCTKAFFAFKDGLQDRKPHYLVHYGIVPEFKVGIHFGKIVTTEVGELKREIAHHSATINTAARIQEKRNIMGVNYWFPKKQKTV